MTITAERLAELRQIATEATCGPWEVEKHGSKQVEAALDAERAKSQELIEALKQFQPDGGRDEGKRRNGKERSHAED